MTEENQPAGPTLLIIEDEDDTANLLALLLKREGYGSVRAADGQEAKRLIDEMAPPTLILLDIHLPHVTGLQLLLYIRKKAEWKQVPVVMLTAASYAEDVQAALAAGATDYVVKPFNPQTLVSRLQRFLPSAS